MKKILIIGENSYIGESFAKYANEKYNIKTISSISEAWKDFDFSGYDCVLHCAGIAHVAHKNDDSTKALYKAVNCDLTANVASKAKAEGVRQFIFPSTILVYGNDQTGIDLKTAPNPKDFYSKSKLRAEYKLHKLADDNFKICIIRPPMVYGPGCKGNFPRLVDLAKKTPIFPNYHNSRSMIYIENLCNFFCKLIDYNKDGLFFPQNAEYVCTTKLVKLIAENEGRRMRTTKIFNPLINVSKKRVSTIGKMFDDLTYAKAGNESDYNVVTFEESVKRSVGMPSAPGYCQEHRNVAIPPSKATHPTPSVSIITATHNSEETLKDTIESVLNQTTSPLEYIIIDGVSSDGTLKLAESYQKAFYDKGIEYIIISEPDNGIYDAMNKGILEASGDIIGIINSDDWYEPQAIEKAIHTYKETHYDMMFADLMIHQKKGCFVKKAGITRWVHSRNWNHPTTFTHKRIYEEDLFSLKSVYDDFNLYLKLRKENKNIVVLNEVLANYRLGGKSNKKGLSNAFNRMIARYKIYRDNGYSRLYIFECFLIEGAKFLLI